VSAAPKERPEATGGDAIADISWFSAEANRGPRYRLRPAPTAGFWLIRRRGGNTFLRAWTASPPPGLVDTDDCLRQTWFATAWPGVNPKTLHKLIKTAAKRVQHEGASHYRGEPRHSPGRTANRRHRRGGR
jgi:hypothetical protein